MTNLIDLPDRHEYVKVPKVRQSDVLSRVGLTTVASYADVASRWTSFASSELMVMTDSANSFLPIEIPDAGAAQVPAVLAEEAFFVYDSVLLGDNGFAKRVEPFRAAGARIGMVKKVVMPLVIVDRDVVLVPADRFDLSRGAVSIRDPRLVQSFRSMFVTAWSQSTPFVPDADGALDERDWKILRLLNAGMTDSAAARALGISLRTYRRCVADIMLRLKADSRFQAGAAADRRGWLAIGGGSAKRGG